MKRLLFIAFLAAILSCSNEPESNVPNTPPTQSETAPQPITDTANLIRDSASSDRSEVAEKHEPAFPIGTFKTLPEIMRNLFSEGSTKVEVRNVQGQPEMIENPTLYEEVWYYGNCEVHFKGVMVRGVVNPDKSIRYASLYGTLLYSPDKIEIMMFRLLNDRIMR